VFKQYVRGFGLTFALLTACVAAHASQVRDSTNGVYLKAVAAASLRHLRTAKCEKIAGKSIADDISSEAAMEKSTMAEEKLLLKQQDCHYLSDFYAELRFAAVHEVLATSAWYSCLHEAPVGDLSSASEVGTYIECLRAARRATACTTSGSRSDSPDSRDAACTHFIGALKWQAVGEDWYEGPPIILPWPSHRDDSLFGSSEAAATRSRAVILPSAVTLRGVVRTGFYVNCCSFGWGYRFPFSYMRLDHTIILSEPGFGSEPTRDIELDTAVPGSTLDKPVTVTCGTLDFVITGHYAEQAYCSHTSVRAARTAARSLGILP
jgi:hypothetical protein